MSTGNPTDHHVKGYRRRRTDDHTSNAAVQDVGIPITFGKPVS
jgi:hypothetical protein